MRHFQKATNCSDNLKKDLNENKSIVNLNENGNNENSVEITVNNEYLKKIKDTTNSKETKFDQTSSNDQILVNRESNLVENKCDIPLAKVDKSNAKQEIQDNGPDTSKDGDEKVQSDGEKSEEMQPKRKKFRGMNKKRPRQK